MNKTSFKNLKWDPHPSGLGGEQALVEFENGYMASILRGAPNRWYTKGGTYEAAVLHKDVPGCVYDTEITDDVLAQQTKEEIEDFLRKVEALPKRNN